MTLTVIICFAAIVLIFLRLKNKLPNLLFFALVGIIGFVLIPLLEFKLYSDNRNNYIASDAMVQNEINAQILKLENDIQSRANKLTKEDVLYLLQAIKSLPVDSVLEFRQINYNDFSISCKSLDLFNVQWVIEKNGLELLNINKRGGHFILI